MARKSISVFESGSVNEAASRFVKKCETVEKMLKELNTYAKKITTLKNEDKDGFEDNSKKLGELDSIALDLESLINRIAKL